jgi:phage terminase large subunit-like protein
VAWTPLQIRFLLWWYAVDKSGRFLYDRAQIVLPKGSGKSPLAAAIGCCELGAEVLYDGRDAAGNPVGRPQPSPWVQLAAVSEDQTTNTMSLVIAMLREGHANETIPGLDTGLTRIFTANGKLEPVTASAPSREGQRLTAAVLDEPHLWLPSNGGIRLAATIRRNLAKMGGRSIETTNAWRDGEDSVAEATSRYADLAREGKTRNARILRMHPDRDGSRPRGRGLAARRPHLAVRGHAVDRHRPHRGRGLRPEHGPGRRSPVLPERDHLRR